ALRGLIEPFGTGTAHCSSHRKALRLLAPPKTSRWSLAYSSCRVGFSFSTSCFTIPIHPIIIYMILSFVNSKRYLVNWNARWRLLENIDQFSSCDVTLP